MIVKILNKSETFKGVTYNTNKMEMDKGELMKVENFGALQGIEHLRPKDYINYLEARSASSARIKYPQFHAVISCKGKSHTKEQLTQLATDWLKGMGYEKQPYLLVFHKDTNNNHIHIVSTRVDQNGKKISDSYEKLRAYQVLNKIMGLDEKQKTDNEINKALAYNFSTRAQFMMLLECQGYSLQLENDKYIVSKYGTRQGAIDLQTIDARRKLYTKDINRLAQLRAIIEKYKKTHSPAILPISTALPEGRQSKPTGYTSDLAEVLASKFGVQILFHGKPGLPPYGYTVIDHSMKTVYKGKELMPLENLIGMPKDLTSQVEEPSADFSRADQGIVIGEAESPTGKGELFIQPDTTAGVPNIEDTTFFLPEINLDLADDIDDEAILGRNRQRKRKARTNTR
ncbi:relaxase/mobilization nuclease domain-containing protein [Pedobacter sp. ASV28]|uniref:relaxase/mobilization nuclease domain-containing protein n=1 Tax=Pedobacter sp. ASV28 TaxID=2795123 RepID=UPI0018EB1409|nr:relaxase/mobilization nuclease domain-containing protein [Pedobacter sp. ASV28]